jgi:hypothetical protein
MIHVQHWCDKPVTCLYLHLMHLYYFLSTNLDLIPHVLILNAPFITLGPFAHLIPQKHFALKRNYANEPNQSKTRG